MAINLLIFDFDGVLVESLDLKGNAFGRLFAPEGEEVVRQVLAYHASHGGVSRYDKFRYFYSEILKRELSDRRFEELCTGFSELVLDEVVRCPFVPGAREFLERHSGTIPCYVTSATPEGELGEIVARRGMTQFFKRLYGAPTSKTSAVAEILEATGTPRNETLYIGDARTDYQAAAANGIHFIARSTDTDDTFNGIDCPRITDLTSLHGTMLRL